VSFQEEWVLPASVQSYADDDLLRRVRRLLPDDMAVRISGQPSCRTITVDLAESEVQAVASKLEARGQLAWDWRDDMEPPRSGDAYDLHIELVDDGRPILRVYSNSGENRRAWPLAFSIAEGLADDLGAIPEEDAPPPSDRIPLFIEPGKTSKPN